VYVTFEDGEHRQIAKAKGKQTWHDFIMQMIKEN